MWTNIFRVGEFQVITWFQFLPSDPDPTSLNDKSSKAEQKDAATFSVISAHLRLQNDGFLSTWTNSFVGPWDPSQGVHNPDEKIKLWLFIPGRHSSLVEPAQAAVSKLRVVGRGVWLAPGDSEEVAVALSQAFRNSIERAFRGLSYVRFGDVFAKSHSASSGKSFRKAHPTCEFIFAATEEAIYIHVIISAKHLRNLNDDDIERVLKRSSSNSVRKGLPVFVSPNGMRGRLTGCCPTDLVKQVYTSKLKANNESAHVLPSISRSTGYQLRGQNCFVEVTLGCPSTSNKDAQERKRNQEITSVTPKSEEPCLASSGKNQQFDPFPILERTFIYPAESVLVPVLHRAFARSSLKRFFLKSWTGTSFHELWPFWNFPSSSQFLRCEFLEAFGIDFSGTGLKRKHNSSSNNSSCSSTSSTGSTSSGSDHAAGIVTGDLEADADSLTSRQSGLSSNDQFDNDGKKMVSKRLRSSVTDVFGQAATVASVTAQNAAKSEFSVVDANNSAIGGSANVQVGSSWDWDDDDRGIGIDIQSLLAEFGDFGDFFENDVLDFGEPPGTAESQVIVFPSVDCGDISGSPCTAGIDSPDQRISAVGLTSFENYNQPSSTFSEDTDGTKDAKSSVTITHSLESSNGKFDNLMKAEAMLTFSPEYAAVEICSSEFSISIFRNPYLPGSKKVETSLVPSCAHVYGATPPSPSVSDMEESFEKSSKLKPGIGLYAVSSGQLGKLYTLVKGVPKKIDSKLFNDVMPSHKGQKPSSLSVMKSSSGTSALQINNDSTFEAGHFLLSLETLLATEIECIIFQVAMCRIRHTLLSFNSRRPIGLNKLTGDAMLDLISYDTNSLPDVIPNKHEAKKKDMLPVRIAGDVHIGMLDAPLTSSVGVWRPVGVPKGTKPSNTCLPQNSPSLPHNLSNEETFGFRGQRQPLQELLDAIGLLVQQSASLVDVSLDMDDVDGSYSWLALEEQQRRGFSCGPSMVHAGCGGIFASCHYVDIAGIELIDPLSANVQVSNVISLLQSDIKLGLKSAFPSSEGPLSLTEWCRGRHQLGDSGASGDGHPFQYTIGEVKDPLSTVSLGGEPISPPQSGCVSSCIRDGVRIDDSTQRRSNQDICGSESDAQKFSSRFKPTLAALSLPALLVGYQDDWLKTSVNCLQLWEKAPLEPYASPKPVSYFALCPDIDLLTSAGTDFFQQLGTVYEACKLGSHTLQINGGLMESSSGKLSSSGLLLVNCPQELKVASSNMLSISSITDYFVALSKCWNVKGYLNSVKKVLKGLKLAANPSPNHKERNVGPCMVVYVVCPFPEPTAVLQTVIECSAALGSGVLAPDKDRQSLLYNQVAKSLISSAAVDEASASNVVMLSGFRIPKLVLQIVTVDCLLRLNRPSKELGIFKEIAFTVYNKIRRIPRTASGADIFQSSAISGRPQSTLMHVTSPIPGIWKDCLAPRISGPALTREAELDSSLRPVPWDNSWQTRIGGLSSDPHRSVELCLQDDPRYVFEPLFVLAEPGSVEHAIFPAVLYNNMPECSSSKSSIEDNSSIYVQSSSTGGAAEIGKGSSHDGSEHDNRAANLHCSYGWTEDWRWLICVWTDSRGELLDCSIFPFGGISSRQDTKVLQNLFVQVLHHSCQILSSSSLDSGSRLRDIIITRIGCYFELECQEWQKAIYSVGGNDVKKWPVQLRRTAPDGVLNNSGASLEQQEISLIQERALPSSPSPLYNPHAKPSFIKGGLGQTNAKKQILAGQAGLDSSRGLLQLARSISLVSVSMDHTLHLILPSDLSSSGVGQSNSSSSGISNYLEGFSPVKSLGSMPGSYLLIPSPSMRFLPPSPLQLPTCLTSESPPLAHLLHSKGSAIPQSTGFVVSKSIPNPRKDFVEPIKEDCPSILSVGLVDHYGGQEKLAVAVGRGGGSAMAAKQGRSLGPEPVSRDYEVEANLVLESVAAELHSLSWMTVSPLYLERRSALPFHCDILLRLRRLLHYADKEFSKASEQLEPADTDL
ncbi:mediator of RNA polymerase II transcription subunit 13 isoform X1 [Dendrobium catenatum]|uniref:mediator of RNA polymerase II transcription subunit 13 isoform X1 n=1 Tax=Dendrobium catenatum TaxID=906689 RepID=UPI0009F5A19B|nr:mediator of RNA polymerase II transcription subunit 13 isoform X1 [Dendrobium catenatum]XP_020677959.1 mediator of RNA polymerase II transcription subunit 13 isoform X1 [Dendrobium catenatum]XP_028551158.1 mediator of RNA polymerase II transcription subunit 13 isoform X1 [Dendrobium catenatum]XP_028551159.1 mediator of RNA polymerase II transcription subunit 13 isoform X1 [Dendrobium catenatum]XP_028551160.1 mediator of RNA polymerase II transcription subunit 13 isoform X1 [Dendrobium catena